MFFPRRWCGVISEFIPNKKMVWRSCAVMSKSIREKKVGVMFGAMVLSATQFQKRCVLTTDANRLSLPFSLKHMDSLRFSIRTGLDDVAAPICKHPIAMSAF